MKAIFRHPSGVIFIGKCLCLLLFWIVAYANNDENTTIVKLMHDPFRKPQHLPETNQNPIAIPNKENLFLTASRLTATLRAGKNSMVILDGKTLKLGDSIERYQLIDVKEQSAIFTKNGQLHTLKIDKTNENK
jgi:hypothetical protein